MLVTNSSLFTIFPFILFTKIMLFSLPKTCKNKSIKKKKWIWPKSYVFQVPKYYIMLSNKSLEINSGKIIKIYQVHIWPNLNI